MSVHIALSPAHPVASRLPFPLQRAARDLIVRHRHRGLTDSDLLIAAYPKSGSTWLRFILASALTSRDMDFDLVEELSPPLGHHMRAPSVLPQGGRLIMSHEKPHPFTLGQQPQILCLVRDGRDVAVSRFHHLRRRGVETGDFAAFMDLLVAGRVGYYGSWHSHVRKWTEEARRCRQVMFVRYEDLLADPVSTLMTISDRFRLLLGEAALRSAIAKNSASTMRKKESSSRRLNETSAERIPFVRSASSGEWREVFDKASLLRFESLARRELIELGYEVSGSI